MDDFVRDKLTEWGLSELLKIFEDEVIDTESLFCLTEQDIDTLIPKMGPRARFKMRLKILKEEEHSNQEIGFPAQSQQQHEEETHKTETLPSMNDTGKRKMHLQGESSLRQPAEKRKRESASITELRIFSNVKKIMTCVLAKLQIQENTKINKFLKTKIKNLETDKRELVGVFGKTGAGKTSLINAVIGEKGLLPTGSISACTSVMIKVEANRHNQKYEAELEFISKEEWEDELGNREQFLKDDADQERNDDDNDEFHDLVEKLSALYAEDWKQKSTEQLMDPKNFREIPEFFQSTRKTLTCESAKELSEKMKKYTIKDKNQGGDEDVKRWFWPLVKCVTVRVPHNNFLQHVTLVDLPGNGDRNKSRDQMWKGIVGNCSTVWIVSEIKRAAADKESWEILKSACSLLGNGGECRHIHFICTMSDDIDHSTDDVLTSILKRNTEAKKLVNNEFNKLTRVKNHFSDDCFQVFTVSSKEFFKKKCLSPENTEIPRLQEFLQNLNDCHSETLNYLSGAHGILSLTQGAKSRDKEVGNEDVCKDLERNLSHQIESIRNVMNENYATFERCLQEGVQQSTSLCDKNLKNALYPPRQSGRGFHKQLKKLVGNGGICKPKKGKEINLNRKLISPLTDSIDDEFRKTFPNDGKCGPFNGVINKFSLDAEGLKQKHSDFKLQLIFLKSEEEQMKTKLTKLIRERKKIIYTSLTKTVEEIMQECYEKAAGYSGNGSLKNMRETIENHVKESKNTMFEKAIDVMLGLHCSLMLDVLDILEDGMKESIELSLNIDDHSLPEVSAELTMVQKLQEEILKTS